MRREEIEQKKGTDLNGTYLIFVEWPFFLISALATERFGIRVQSG